MHLSAAGWILMYKLLFSDLYENGSGYWSSFRHHHLALWPIMFGRICKRLPIVPSRHGDKTATSWSPGKLIGHPSDLKRPYQKMLQHFSGKQPQNDGGSVWSYETKWFLLTSSLHVLQFNVDVAVSVERQSRLTPGDHRSGDDTQRAAFHCLPGFSQ